MEQQEEERRRKLEAGRARLAHFRQRKTKGDGSHPQKKTSKRKDASIHSHDLPAQECPLGVQSEEFVADSEINTNVQNKIYFANSDLIDLTIGASSGNTLIPENVDLMDVAIGASACHILSENTNLMDLGTSAGNMLSENVELTEAVQNQTLSENTDITDATIDDSLFSQSLSENTDLTDGTMDASFPNQTLQENTDLTDGTMDASFPNQTLPENTDLTDAMMDAILPNQTLPENTDLTGGMMDSSLPNQTLPENTDLTGGMMDASLPNQTLQENTDLADAAMDACVHNQNLSENVNLVDLCAGINMLTENEDVRDAVQDQTFSENTITDATLDFLQDQTFSEYPDLTDGTIEASSQNTFSEPADLTDVHLEAKEDEMNMDLLQCPDWIIELEEKLLQKTDVVNWPTDEGEEQLSEPMGTQDGHGLPEQTGSQEQICKQSGSHNVEDLEEHTGSLVILQELEAALHERNGIIYQLSVNLQQALQSRDEFQGEASLLATQFQALQQRMKEAKEFLKSKSPRKPDLPQSLQKIEMFQINLREQNTRLQMLGEKAREMEQQLEFSEKNPNEKENLLTQMNKKLKCNEYSVQELHQTMMEKEETIKGLQDKLDFADGNVSMLQQALSLREQEVADLKMEIASVRQKEYSTIDEDHAKAMSARLQELKAELEDHHRERMTSMRQELHDELDAKHRDDLERVSVQLCTVGSDQNIQSLNPPIDLNRRLHESETLCESLRHKFEDQMEEFQRDRCAAELWYSNLLGDIQLQLNCAEEQAREVVACKHEKERLNKEVQELQGQLLRETEKNEVLRHQHDAEIQIYAVKLQKLQQEKESFFQELVESHKADLEKIQGELSHRYEGELQLLHQELALQRGLRVDTLKHDLEDLKKSLNQVKSRKEHENHESADVLKERKVGALDSSIDDDSVMAKYLAHTTLQEHSPLLDISDKAFDCVLSPHGKFELDSELLLEPSLNSTLNYEPFCSPLPITDVLVGGVAHGRELDAESFAVYLSRNALPDAELSDINENLDEDKACLIQRCYVLIKQLEEKDKDLRASSEALQEAQEKWKDVTDTLLAAHEELALYKQEISWKSQQGNYQENQMYYLEEQPEQDGRGLPYTGLQLQTQESNCLALQETIKELQQEKDMLLGQLGGQEQPVKDVQEQKTAGDSVTSEVQSLFGRQLTFLESQRDELQTQLEAHKAKNVIISELLGQKTMLEDSLRKEQDSLRSVISSKEESLTLLTMEKSKLQERLSSVEQRLEEVEQAHEQSIQDQERLENSHAELESQLKQLEGAMESARLEYDFQLNSKDLEREELAKEIKEKETAHVLREQELAEVDRLKMLRTQLESHLQEEDLGLSSALQEAQAEVRNHYEAELKSMAALHSQEVKDIQAQHQIQVDRLKSELDASVQQVHQKLEGEWKEQIVIIKQVHEREHDREIAELVAKHRQEMDCVRKALTIEQQHVFDELQEQAAASHQAEMQHALLQAQTMHHLEMEALRLSLTNMHTAHLELSQSNLQKERETALVELREMLNSKRAQEVALLQSRHQFELERVRELHGMDLEECAIKHHREMEEKQKLELELSVRHEQTVQALRRDLEAGTDVLLKTLRVELSDLHHLKRDCLHAKHKELEDEVESLSLDKEQAQMMRENLQNKYQLEVKDLREQLEHEQHLREQQQKGQARDDEQRQQIEKIHEAYEELKTRSEQEIRQLWSQLDSTRTSRQELSELREQLLARTSHVAEIERVKQDFELQRQQLKAAHETELEQLRLYFEQKLRGTEENYKEELTLLHQRLWEVKDETLEEPAADLSSSAFLHEISESRNHELLEQLTQQLEQHKEELMYVRLQAEERQRHEVECARSSLALQFKEDLLNLKLQLSDQCICEIEALKKKHCLELEQLRAKLSDQHIREITKLNLQSAQDAARLVESEVAARVCVLDGEHQTRLALLQSEKQHITDLKDLTERQKSDHAERAADLREQPEVSLRDELEQVTCQLREESMQDTERARRGATEVQQKHKGLQAEWRQQSEEQIARAEEEEERKPQSEQEAAQEQENLANVCTEVQQQAEREKTAQADEFELHEAEMERVQEDQAARIVELEKLLKEQQNSMRQMEDSLASECATQRDLRTQYDIELAAAKASMQELEEATQHLIKEYTIKLKDAEIRSMEEQREMSEKLSSQHEAALQELRQKYLCDLRSLGQHRGQMDSLPEELHAEHRAEAQALRAELESQQQAQLESRLTELQAAHRAQIDELETKHLSNLDTLESSYLSEIQTIRHEHKRSVQDLEVFLSQRLQEKEDEMAKRLASEAERLQADHDQELQLAKEALRKELAALHMETFQAMASELEAAHGEDLNEALHNQRGLLEAEHHQALDVVREEVLKMEEQHKSALQELQDLHTLEVQRQNDDHEHQLEQLRSQHKQQKADDEHLLAQLQSQHEQQQQMCAIEAETLQRTLVAQLEEKTKQLGLLQDEMELLKRQSEALLEQQISQLKAGFEAERKSSLLEKEQFELDAESLRSLHKQEREQLLGQIQEKTEIIFQLEQKVSSLNQKMEESNLQLDTLVQRRERENQECETLVAMLRSDADSAHNNQKSWQDSYQRVLKLFTEMVKSTIATEDLISRKVGLCLDDSLASGGAGSDTRSMTGAVGVLRTPKYTTERDDSERLLDSPDCDTMTDHSVQSTLTDEGCELSEHLCESLFGGPELLAENEVRILKISQRLRTAVERLLELVRDSTKQLEQTHEIQAHFEEEFTLRNQETAHVVRQQQQELLQRLNEESEGKKQLTLELHKAQGIIEGYAAEKAALEEALNEKEDSRHRVVVELEKLRDDFQVLSQEQAILREEQGLLCRQKAALSNSPAGVATDLLKELEHVSQEKLELKCQSEKDRSNMQSQMKVLEAELEDQVNRNQELAQKTSEVSDLRQQIQALEKQLRNQRQFMDEQAIEREHERDDFQQEIQRLEGQLKLVAKSQGAGEGRGQGVDSLQARVKEKADGYNLLLLGKEQLEREIADQNEDIEKMAARIQQLEQAVLTSAETEKRCSQLEQDLLKMQRAEKELLQDKESLQKQQYSTAMQISALQSKLDEARHRFPSGGDTDHALKQQLLAEHEALLIKEKEVESLAEQLEQFREELMNKTEEALQLHMQLEVQKKQSEDNMRHLQEENILLKEDLSSLHGRTSLHSEGKASPLLPYPHILLEEKNQEIDHLNEQIVRLQHEMKCSTEKQFVARDSTEMEELKSCIEHLRGDQERLRRDKDEEVEQLHEVIEKLQQELTLLGPNRHEVSDSQDSLDELGFGAAENLKDELRKGSQASLEQCHQRERNVSESTVKEMQEELELVCTAREALQQLLEEKEAQFTIEVEILEQNLQSVQESARQQLQELTSLRLQYSTLQEEYHLLRTHLSQRDAEMGIISARVQELEDTLREKESTLIERELQLKTLEEQRMSELNDCEHLAVKVAELQAELTKRDLLLMTESEESQALRLEGTKQDLLLQDLLRKEEDYCKEIDGLKDDAVRLEAQIQVDLTELQALCSARDQLRAQLQGTIEKEKGLIKEMSELQQRLAERDHEVQTLTEKLMEWETSKSDLKSEEQDLRDMVIHLQEQLSTEEVVTGGMLQEDLLSQMEAQQEELEAEMATVKQELSYSEEKNSHALQQLKEKDVVVADFQTHSQNLKTQINQLQETLLKQESELSSKEEEICHLKQQIVELQGHKVSLTHAFGNSAHLEEPSIEGHKGFTATLIDLSPWCSPEVVRQQESSIEHLHSLHAATPFSEISVAYSTDMEMMAAKCSLLQGDASDILGYQSLFTSRNQYSKDCQDFRTQSFSRSNSSSSEFLVGEKIHLASDDAAFSFTLSASQEDLGSSPSIPEVVIDGYGSQTSLGSPAELVSEQERAAQLDADFLSFLDQRKVRREDGDTEKGKAFTTKTTLSPQLQTMLTMVHEESCKVLALSQRPSTLNPPPVPFYQSVQSENWQLEKQTLLDAVQSLKDLIAKAEHSAEESRTHQQSPDRRHPQIQNGPQRQTPAQDPLEPRSDWRGELLHAVQVLFEKERVFLCSELRSHLCSHASGDEGSLLEKLEHIVKEQEEQQRMVLEHLLSSDRSSLLSEIQELRAQLRMTHLQNQEKLQLLQESITNAEDHGSKQEHQLRRQVELLEYKLQQETSIAGDLQTSLSREQERASELRKHLGEEREATSQLKSELTESKQQLERLLLSQEGLQREISRLSSMLEAKEKDLSAAAQSLQTEQAKEQQQQALWEQERLLARAREDQKTRTLQDLEAALEELNSQKKQMSVALEHEQASVSNLRKELQIEQSRCEALLGQERGKLTEIQHSLELEKTRSAELASTLQHERTLLEQLSKRQTNEEYHRQQREALLEQSFVLDLQAQLEEERQRAVDLAAMVEKTQQQAIQSKRQLEAEVHLCREENQKEQEVSTKLRATLVSLKGQNQEVLTVLEMQREREAALQSERDQLEARLLSLIDQEQSKQEERENKKRREQQADNDREKNCERDREMLHELQRQHQRDELRIKELQQTLAELEEEERHLALRKRQRANPSSPPNPSLAFTPDLGTVCVQQLQKMEKMRQQLLFATIHLKEFGKNVSDRSFTEFSDEESLTSLLQMLTELKLELQRLSSLAQKPIQGSPSLTDALLVENDELTKSVITLTEEKLRLQREISTLGKKLQHPLHRATGADQVWSLKAADPAPDAERKMWQREKLVLQNALKQSEAELAKVTAGIENRPVTEPSNSKLQRLYRKYLRAESFRKALVYQKKYLLLLLGGFQDCEQATLSMIARMGVYPSPVDLQVATTRPHAFTKFRSTVRAVIAISRLKFLVKKWQKVHRKGVPVEAQTQVLTPHSAFGIRPEVLRHSVILNSPPTRELTSCHRSNSATIVSRSPKSPYLLHNRSHAMSTASPNRSRTSTQEPEHSLMEYIHHLEVIQQRLGGLQQGPSPGHSHERMPKK